MAFVGFPEEALDFYEGLEADNSKTYWTEHKSMYDECVAGPMKALLEELKLPFGVAKLFRPYRDVRFSKDKTPYKTRQYAVVHTGDQGLYVGIDAHGLHLGGGMFHTSSQHVALMRSAVAADTTGSALKELLDTLQRKGFQLGGEQLKRIPKPWDESHSRAQLLRYKSLTAYIDHEPAPWLHTPKAKAEVVSAWKAVGPLNAWFATNTAI